MEEINLNIRPRKLHRFGQMTKESGRVIRVAEEMDMIWLQGG